MTSDAKSKADLLLERAYALSNPEETKALYRDWAGFYDTTMVDELGYLTPTKVADLVTAELHDNGAKILDVGSGTGLAGEALAARGFTNLEALDYSPQMLEVAQKRRIYGSTHCMDLNKPLALPDEVYDALVCTGTFTHSHVTADCLPELFRILKPGGLFGCTVHKDVWDPSGFDVATLALEKAGAINTVKRDMGRYFDTDNEPQGWFILWRKST